MMPQKTKGLRRKVDPKVLVSAYVKRKNDILRSDMSVLPLKCPGWSRLARDLGNVYAPSTLANMVRRHDIKEALIAANSTTDASSKPLKGRRPVPLIVSGTENRKPRKNVAIDNVRMRKAQLVLPTGYPNSNVLTEQPVSCYTANLEGEQSSLKADNKIHQLQARVEIDDIFLSRYRPVSTKVCPDETIPKEEPGSPQAVKIMDERKWLSNVVCKKAQQSGGNARRIADMISTRSETLPQAVMNTDDIKFPLNVDHKAKQSEENLKRVADKISTRLLPHTVRNEDHIKLPLNMDHKAQQTNGNLQNIIDKISTGKHAFKVDPKIMIAEIVARKAEIVGPTGLFVAPTDPVWQRISNALGNRFSPTTVWRMANRKEVREFMIDNKREIEMASSNVNRGRRNNAGRDVIDALLRLRAEIVLPDGSYVSKENPVWLRIATSLGNNLSAIMVYQIAKRPEVRERIINEDKKRKIEATSTGKDVPRKRSKIDHKTVLNAILARKAEVVRLKQYYAPKEDPVWSRIREDLGNRIAPSTLYLIACRKDVRELAFEKDEIRNVPSLIGVEEEDDTAGTENFRNEINEMVFEDAITKLLRTVDSTDGLTKEIKELRKDLNELKNVLYERDSNKSGSEDQPIVLN